MVTKETRLFRTSQVRAGEEKREGKMNAIDIEDAGLEVIQGMA